MSDSIKRYALGISTCPSMHTHGNAKIQMSYDADNPLTFRMSTTLARQDDDGTIVENVASLVCDIYRESVHFWLLNAPAGSLLVLGETSLKVRLSQPWTVVFKFPFTDVGGDEPIAPMFIMSREYLQRFLADTYVAVPIELECDRLGVDECIAKILESSK